MWSFVNAGADPGFGEGRVLDFALHPFSMSPEATRPSKVYLFVKCGGPDPVDTPLDPSLQYGIISLSELICMVNVCSVDVSLQDFFLLGAGVLGLRVPRLEDFIMSLCT